jgi:hypothetical protein
MEIQALFLEIHNFRRPALGTRTQICNFVLNNKKIQNFKP